MIKPVSAVGATPSRIIKFNSQPLVMDRVSFKANLKADLANTKARINDGISRTMEKENEKNKNKDISPVVKMMQAMRAMALRKAQG